MSLPVYIPNLTSNPVGWAVLGAAGIIAYKLGKKSGAGSQEQLDTPSLGDRIVKGTMKTAYKATKSAKASLGKAGEKYSSLWEEAKAETQS